jgi:hypothetical protein
MLSAYKKIGKSINMRFYTNRIIKLYKLYRLNEEKISIVESIFDK